MKKLESNFKNMVLALSSITLFAALALGSVYTLTKDPIAVSKTAKQQNAIKDVLPPFDHFDQKPIEVNDGVEVLKVYKAYDKSNDFVGAAVETSSNNGFSGKISLMVGFDKAGAIVNYSVLEQKETPGLGAKMLNWFKTNNKSQSIIGKNPATVNLSVSKDGGEIDAITAATISSRAFLFAVRNAYAAYCQNSDHQQCDSIKVK
ncbi:MAG: RnfABCDGE type electron transport complex subunit G [Paludibacter sp.]|jgi:electron transport complex protein RnfG